MEQKGTNVTKGGSGFARFILHTSYLIIGLFWGALSAMGQAAPGSPLRAVMADTNHVFYTNTFFDANYTNGLLHALTNNPDIATAAQLTGATNGVATNALSRTGSQSVYRFYNQPPAPGSIAEVCPYPTAIAGTPNYGASSGQTVFQAIATNQSFRFMLDGTVSNITIWVGPTNGMTGAYGQTWKPVNRTNFDLSGTSSPLWPLVPNSANTFAVTGLTNVAKMDFPGLLVTYSSATVQNLFGTNGMGQFGGTPTTNAGGGYYSFTLQGATNVAWTLETQTAISVPLLFYMASPDATASGDSIVSGTPDTGSGADDQAGTINPTMSMPYLVGQALGIRILDSGQSGDRWNPSLGMFQARYTNDLCGKGARLAIVSIGDNDIRDGATPAYVAGGWSNIVATCAASNMVVVFSELMPSGGFSTSSLAKESNMVAANYILDQFPTWFPNVLVAKTHDLMGVYWSGGTPGNRMLMNPKYTADGVHPNAAGKVEWARLITKTITTLLNQGLFETGGILSHGDVRLAGGSVGSFGQDRAPAYRSPSNTVYYAQGAALGATNANGGDFIAQAGVSTGTGAAGVSIAVGTPGAPGTGDGTNVITARFVPQTTVTALELEGIAGIPTLVLYGTNDANGNWHYVGGSGIDSSGDIGFTALSSSAFVDLGIDPSGNPFAYPDFYIGGGSAIEKLTVTAGGGLPAYIRIGASGTNSGFYLVDGSTIKYGLIYAETNNTFQILYSGGSGHPGLPVAWFDANGNFYAPSATVTIGLTNSAGMAVTNLNTLSLNVSNVVFTSGGEYFGATIPDKFTLFQVVTTTNAKPSLSGYVARFDVRSGTNMGVYLGYDTNINVGMIGANIEGGANEDLSLPAGNLLVGTTNDVGYSGFQLQVNNSVYVGNVISNLNAINTTGPVNSSGSINSASSLSGTSASLTGSGTVLSLGNTSDSGAVAKFARPPSSFGYNNEIEFDATDASDGRIGWNRDNIFTYVTGRKGIYLFPQVEQDGSGMFGIYFNTNSSGTVTAGGTVTNALLTFAVSNYNGYAYGSFQVSSNLTTATATVTGTSALNGLNSGAPDTQTSTTVTNGITLIATANKTRGSATLSSGTVTVSTTAVKTGDLIVFGVTTSTSPGFLSYSISNGTSFTVTSTSGSDASVFQWAIIH